MYNAVWLFWIIFYFIGANFAYGNALDNFLKGLKNLRADFQQIEYDAEHKPLRTSFGVLYLQKPGRFRWEYQRPYLQTIISNGNQVWFYDPDLAQVTIKPYSQTLANSPALLLSSNEPFTKYFQVIDIGQREELQWFELRPKNTDAGFIKAEIGFSVDQLRAMNLADNFGQNTQLKFEHIQTNLSLSEKLFNFQIPPGADILETK